MSKLDRAELVTVATAAVESGGEGAVSMRALAHHFGVTPMALYRHFANKDELLSAVMERVAAQIRLPAPQDDPVDDIVATAMCVHDFLVDYPWMIRLIATGRLATQTGITFRERVFATANRAGLDDAAAFRLYRTMLATILGEATISGTRTNRETNPRWRELDAVTTPADIFRAAATVLRSPSAAGEGQDST